MKSTLIIISLFFFTLVTICSQCNHVAMDNSYTINLVNKSDYPIGYYFATGGKYGTYYPDSLPETSNYIIYDVNKVLRPGYESHLNWNKFFQLLPHDTLSVFIFSTDTLNKYSWEEVRKEYKILKRYDFSLKDLQQMNWTITYP
jgi:hypothetical protein